MKLQAAKRLHADATSSAEKSKKESLDRQIDQKRKQNETMHSQLPSKDNKTTVSPKAEIEVKKSMNRNKDAILDLQKRKLG